MYKRQYENVGYGITFQVNDDLSVGYNHYESEQDNATDVTAEATSIQIAYSMGGASIKFAETSVDNSNYSTASSDDVDGHTIALTLAF